MEKNNLEIKPLSKRLETVARFVPRGAKLLDVGSDHAYLPIHLINLGQITEAIAGEVVKGPYTSALSNVAESGLADRIQVRLANGLAAFEKKDKVTAITIAGMGGRLIADILEAGKEKLENIDRLILQPNNREDDLRRWLQANQLKIITETLLRENGKYYEVLVVEKGHMTLSEKDFRFGPYLRKEGSEVFVEKWRGELDKLNDALKCIPENRQQDRSILLQKIEMIQGVLDVSL